MTSDARPIRSVAAGGTGEAPRHDPPLLVAQRERVVIERVQPEIDGGRFPVKRCVGDSVRVTADIFADGHDLLAGVLKYRRAAGPSAAALLEAGPQDSAYPGAHTGPAPQAPWTEVPLAVLGNDRWSASFTVAELGIYEYTLEAWIDRFGTWLRALSAKAYSGQDVNSELLEGAELVQTAAAMTGPDPDEALRLLEIADTLRGPVSQAARVAVARDPALRAMMASRPDRRTPTTYERRLRVRVDPVRARVGAWYEMFPRSCTTDPTRSGTLREAESRLPDIVEMGFDVLYLAPVHPIGRSHRKGRNNSPVAQPGDPGSPWAIGSEEGGHRSIDPGLGTIDDFDRFVALAGRLGLQVALDIAFQASPDHPWVREHPEWFRHRPDGSIKHAENPPKQYQDIYPLDFEGAGAPALWHELRDVFLFWAAHGVTIFRVDNPHTKAFRFWEWVIDEVKQRHAEAIFLSEAFTRPVVMYYLAKLGFSQSYTYFTWRNSPQELREYLTELTATEVREYFRPNFFANTPDILHEYLQSGRRAAFEARLLLAATLSASYGIYSGFELCEHVPVRHGSEEYLDSEKYQIAPRDWNAPGHIKELIARVNQVRHEQPALQQNSDLRFHATDNPNFLWFSKGVEGSEGSEGAAGSGGSRVFVVVNTDPVWLQHGWVQVPMSELGLSAHAGYVVEDQLDGARYTWHGEWNYVRLDPTQRAGHIFVIRDL